MSATFCPSGGNRKAGEIQRRDVIRLVENKAQATPKGIAGNYLLSVIRGVFNWAIERDLVEANPCWSVKPPARHNARDRVLSEAEIRLVWQKLNEAEMCSQARLAVRFLLATGQRSGEVLGLRLAELDESREWWTIPKERCKNGLAHRVPITLLARELLQQASPTSRYAFPSPHGGGARALTVAGLSNAVRNNLEHFGVEEFTPHDLRRTVASQMGSLGVDRLAIGKVLNHAEKGVTAVYDRHSYDGQKRAALTRWEGKLRAILSGETPDKVVSIG